MRYNMYMKRKIVHRHHSYISYPVDTHEKLYTIVLRPLLVVAGVALILLAIPHSESSEVGATTIALATAATVARLAVAYVLAVIAAIPLSLLVTRSLTIEAFLLPLFDVIESVPILALFPVLIILFVQGGFYNGAAVAILFLTMVWSLVFTMVGGIKIIPIDILFAAKVFGIKGVSLVRKVILPSIVPQFVTGSILAVAQAWNIIIVAEVLHTYIPGGSAAQDVFGIGALLVDASARGAGMQFFECVVAMIVVIALFNFFVWQKLLNYSQRFRFD